MQPKQWKLDYNTATSMIMILVTQWIQNSCKCNYKRTY